MMKGKVEGDNRKEVRRVHEKRQIRKNDKYFLKGLRKIIPAIFAPLLSFSLVGCGNGYPCVKISQSLLENEMKIEVGNQYQLLDYDKEYTENGCTIKINFINK